MEEFWIMFTRTLRFMMICAIALTTLQGCGVYKEFKQKEQNRIIQITRQEIERENAEREAKKTPSSYFTVPNCLIAGLSCFAVVASVIMYKQHNMIKVIAGWGGKMTDLVQGRDNIDGIVEVVNQHKDVINDNEKGLELMVDVVNDHNTAINEHTKLINRHSRRLE